MADKLIHDVGTRKYNIECSARVFMDEIAERPFCKPGRRNKPAFYKPDYSIYPSLRGKFESAYRSRKVLQIRMLAMDRIVGGVISVSVPASKSKTFPVRIISWSEGGDKSIRMRSRGPA